MAWQWKLVQPQCVGCGICADVCAYGAIDMTREMAYPSSGPSACVGCLLCMQQCPVDAIEVHEEPAPTTC
jgi:Pyruvate/2-oxoacid:ferredoxin oxidoreductase delta subunit